MVRSHSPSPFPQAPPVCHFVQVVRSWEGLVSAHKESYNKHEETYIANLLISKCMLIEIYKVVAYKMRIKTRKL